jgi:hypothetical protein
MPKVGDRPAIDLRPEFSVSRSLGGPNKYPPAPAEDDARRTSV